MVGDLEPRGAQGGGREDAFGIFPREEPQCVDSCCDSWSAGAICRREGEWEWPAEVEVSACPAGSPETSRKGIKWAVGCRGVNVGEAGVQT